MEQDALIIPPEALLIISDIDLNITFCTNSFLQLSGISKNEILTKSVPQLFEWIPIDKCTEAISQILTYPNSVVFIESPEVPENYLGVKSLIWRVHGLLDIGGKPTGYLLTAIAWPLRSPLTKKREKSEKSKDASSMEQYLASLKKAEDSLRKSERQYRSLSENVPGAVYEFSFQPDGMYGFKFLSPVITKMFGIPVETFCSSFNHVHPDDLPSLIKQLEYVFNTHEPFYFEGRLFTATGELRWHSASSSFSYSTQNGDIIYTGIIQDITNRKLAEERVANEELKLRSTLSKLGDNAWQHNFQTNETRFSDTIFDLLGSKHSDQLNNKEFWWSRIHPDDKWIIEENEKKYKAGEIESHSLQYRVFHMNGSQKWILDRGAVLEKNARGLPLLLIGTHTDITKDVELRTKLQQQEQQKKKEILQAVLKAQEKERQEIAYELHENVNQVLTGCQLILAAELQSKNTDTQLIKNVIQHIKFLIKEIRDINYNLSTSTLQLLGLPQALDVYLSKINNEEDVFFDLDISDYEINNLPDDIAITLFRIMQEQVDNICKHSGATKALIKLSTTKNAITLEITDNGKGFDVNDAKKGLGFANISGRVENVNGRLELASELGKGCSLKATIPLD